MENPVNKWMIFLGKTYHYFRKHPYLQWNKPMTHPWGLAYLPIHEWLIFIIHVGKLSESKNEQSFLSNTIQKITTPKCSGIFRGDSHYSTAIRGIFPNGRNGSLWFAQIHGKTFILSKNKMIEIPTKMVADRTTCDKGVYLRCFVWGEIFGSYHCLMDFVDMSSPRKKIDVSMNHKYLGLYVYIYI